MTGDESAVERANELARTTTIVLAEFAGLRSEIATRTSILSNLILGNLTVLGVVFGIALSHVGNTDVLLLLPLATPCIGILVIDSYRNFDLLGRYIYRVIRPQLRIKSRLKVDGVGVFEWEEWVNKRQFTALFAGPFLLVLFVEFLGPPIAVLIYSIQYHLNHPHIRVTPLQGWLWWTGAVLTGLLILYSVGYLAYSIWHSEGWKKIRSVP
jgi:hypothetical protein